MIPVNAPVIERRIQKSTDRLVYFIIPIHRADCTNQILINLFRLPLFGVIRSFARNVIDSVEQNDCKRFTLGLLLADDPALRSRLGREARATALARYVWDTDRFISRYLA